MSCNIQSYVIIWYKYSTVTKHLYIVSCFTSYEKYNVFVIGLRIYHEWINMKIMLIIIMIKITKVGFAFEQIWTKASVENRFAPRFSNLSRFNSKMFEDTFKHFKIKSSKINILYADDEKFRYIKYQNTILRLFIIIKYFIPNQIQMYNLFTL